MSLKILDRWAHLGPHMAAHWDGVASGCSHTLPASSSPTIKTPPRKVSRAADPLKEHDTDVEGDSPPREEGDGEVEERELAVMRRVFRFWCRKAGVLATAGEEEEDGVECDWTRAINPKVEGRISMVGDGIASG